MIAILLFATAVMGLLVLLLARYGAPPLPQLPDGDARPAMPLATLRQLTAEVLVAMGFALEQPLGDDHSLVAWRDAPLGRLRYVVTLAPAADQAAILSAAESVRGEQASRGLLISPGNIESAGLAGLDVPLDVIDGPHFRQLVARHLPSRLALVDDYHGFAPPARPLVPRPV